MKNKITNKAIKTALGFFALIAIHTNVFAHTGMEDSVVLHNSIHLIIITAGVFLAVIATGYYLYRSLPKAKRVRIKK